MSCRIDIINNLGDTPIGQSPKFIGYGYRFSEELSLEALGFFSKLLANEKTQVVGLKSAQSWQKPSITLSSPFVAEVRYRAGVTDNVAKSVSALLRFGDARLKAGFWQDTPLQKNATPNLGNSSISKLSSGKIYALSDPSEAVKLYNPLIETVEVISSHEWYVRGFDFTLPPVELTEQPLVVHVDLEVTDEALIALSKRGIPEETVHGTRFRGPLGLGLDDLHALRDYYRKLGRQITDIELETFAQTWSEHCKHRFFAAQIDEINEGIFRHYIKSATDQVLKQKPDFCLSVFHDNAGGIAFGDDHVLAFKVETHNSPSALDPYGGAMTGVLGVNRDILGFGMGAEPLANVFGFCLPSRDDERALFRQKDGAQALPKSDELADGVIKGVEEGGNHSGIPTVQGFLYEDPSFRGKPLVYCGTLGILPREIQGPKGRQSSVEKGAQAGDYIYVVGNHVGFDGIHGATFSSVELDDHSPATAVQIGDPITQKNLQDALFKARDLGLYRAVTDNGAGGLSSSIGEMAESAGGAEVWLENVALKYPGLAPWEIWISESQERMLLAVPAESADAFEAHFDHYEVSAQRLGCFRDDGYLRLCYHGEELGTLEMEFLHNGAPKRSYHSNQAPKPIPPRQNTAPSIREVLSMRNFQSRRGIFRRYDHEVQGKSVLKPLIGDVENMVSVLCPDWSKRSAVALSQAFMPYLTETDPYIAGYASVDLAIRRLIMAGVNPDKIAILDNFCWSKPESPERIWQLREISRGLSEAAIDYLAPIVSGKDSMYNDFRGYDQSGEGVEINALPSLLVSAFGVVDDFTKVQSFEFKNSGDSIALYLPNAHKLPRTQIDQERGDGGTERALKGNHCRDYHRFAKKLSDFASVDALGMGGVGFALLRASLASRLGVEIDLPSGIMDKHLGAFAEFDTGFLVTVADKKMLDEDFIVIGEVGASSRFRINDEEMDVDMISKLYFRGGYEGETYDA